MGAAASPDASLPGRVAAGAGRTGTDVGARGIFIHLRSAWLLSGFGFSDVPRCTGWLAPPGGFEPRGSLPPALGLACQFTRFDPGQECSPGSRRELQLATVRVPGVADAHLASAIGHLDAHVRAVAVRR